MSYLFILLLLEEVGCSKSALTDAREGSQYRGGCVYPTSHVYHSMRDMYRLIDPP